MTKLQPDLTDDNKGKESHVFYLKWAVVIWIWIWIYSCETPVVGIITTVLECARFYYPHSPSVDLGIAYNFFSLKVWGFWNKTTIDFGINGFVVKLS